MTLVGRCDWKRYEGASASLYCFLVQCWLPGVCEAVYNSSSLYTSDLCTFLCVCDILKKGTKWRHNVRTLGSAGAVRGATGALSHSPGCLGHSLASWLIAWLVKGNEAGGWETEIFPGPFMPKFPRRAHLKLSLALKQSWANILSDILKYCQ